MKNQRSVILFALLLIVSFPIALSAQSGAVAGRVADQEGNPLAGANVIIIGTNLGAATDANGEYDIDKAPVGEFKVSAHYIGFATSSQQITVLAGTVSEANFALRRSAIDLDT